MRRTGFTLVETVLSVALTGIVIGVIATLYGFATVRLSDAYNQASLSDQVNSFADRMENVIRNATSCVAADSGATLNCTMPTNGIDSDGDGVDDAWYPDKSDSNGNAQYTNGGHVWYYVAGSAGTYHTGSGNVWTAETSGGGSPHASDTDQPFCFYYGGNSRFPLVTGLTVSVNASSHTVTFTIQGSTRIGSAQVTTSNDESSRPMSITRTVMWRNY